MILSLFSNPIVFVLSALSLVVAITVHEFAHAKTADHLGDPTPRLQGRVTLNPLSHLDPWGTLLLLLVGFGWGKPVQFDPFNLEHARRDSAIISVAGPVSNFLMALMASMVLFTLTLLSLEVPLFVGIFLMIFIKMNLLLGVFNLLPIHPLDGFKIVGGMLSESQAREWHQLERFGFLFLIMLIMPFGNEPMLQKIMNPILDVLYRFLIP